MIDTHCHINDTHLYPEADTIIASAVSQGVEIMQVVGYDIESSKRAVELSHTYKEIYAIVGMHPTEPQTNIETAIAEIEKLAKDERVIAIGETGLDYYWQKTSQEHDYQKKLFVAQINLANRLGLPIVVHSREAMEDTLTVLKEHTPKFGGVMHCYSGSAQLVGEFIKLGMYISLAGPVTFKNARVPKEVAAIVPDAKLLIETDAPYLAPHPLRGKRNEPSYLPLIAQAIADIKNTTIEQINAITTNNAKTLFHVKHK